MALVGHISGSTQSNSVIGVSGSVIVANRPGALFPALPGSDVTFFVSGSRDGTGRSVFGGDIVSSGSLSVNGVALFSSGLSGSLTTLANGTSYLIAGSNITITTGSNGSVTISGQAGDITSVAAGTGLSGGGSSGDVTLGINDSIVATVSGTTFKGTIAPDASGFRDLGTTGASWYRLYASQISGSHTKLLDGTSAFIAGSGISITTGSNEAVTISAVAAAVDDFFDSTTAGSIFTTGSVAFRGTDSSIDSPSDVGANAFFFVSGSKGALGAVGINNSVFGGNLVVSGTLKVGTGFEIAEVPSVVTYLDAKTFLNISANGGGVDINDSNDIRFLTPTTVKIGQSFSGVNVGADTNFFVSGTLTDRGTALGKVSTFGGQVVTSGSIFALNGLSGSHTRLIDGTSAFIAGNNISITSASNGAVTISSTGTGDVTGPASSTQYAVALFDDTSGKVLRNSSLTTNGSNSLWIASDLAVSGSTTFGDATSDTVTFTARVNSSILPSADVSYDLGSETRRWANMYTGDLHLKNDRGDYTLIEEEDMLTIRFNKTGKRYKFLLEAVPQFDEDPTLKF